MAEEIVHHLQAKEGFPEIVNLFPLGYHYPYNLQVIKEKFADPLISVIFDIASRRYLLERGINIIPLLKRDLKNVRNAMNEALKNPVKLKKLRLGDEYIRIANFPNYLLWWYDLYRLGLKPYHAIWENEVYPTFKGIMNSSVLSEWGNLTSFIGEFKVITKNEAALVMEEVCKQLVKAKPKLKQRRTHGRPLKSLKLKELVPP